MVFQKPNPFPKSIYDNIAYGPRLHSMVNNRSETDEVVYSCLSQVGLLTEVRDRINQSGTELSGGQQQRLCIARAIAVDPDVLLMDEPFGALDAQTREHLQFQLLDINTSEKKTTIFVTHDVEEAILLANRIIIFSARPARIVKEIDVDQLIPSGDRRNGTANMETFMALRTDILKIIRAEYTESLEGA